MKNIFIGGTAKSGKSLLAKKLCEKGKYKVGHTVAYGSTSTCSQCPVGYRDGKTIEDKIAQSACLKSVNAGYRVATANAAESECENGKYSTAHNVTYGSTSTCSPCPAGYKDGTTVANKTSQSTCLKNVEAWKGLRNYFIDLFLL